VTSGRTSVAALAAGILLLGACGGSVLPAGPLPEGVPAGPYTEALGAAAVGDAVHRLHVADVAGGPGVVHVFGEVPWDVDSQPPPPTPDALLSYPVTGGRLGDPVVTREGADYPATDGARETALAVAGDGDALLLAEGADPGTDGLEGTGALVLVRVDVQGGGVRSVDVPLEGYPPDPDGTLEVLALACADDVAVCVAVLSDGGFDGLLVRFDAGTGELLATAPVRAGDRTEVVGPVISDDGGYVAVVGVDEDWSSSDVTRRVWVQPREAGDLRPLGEPVHLTGEHG
jgi:hypothetical protein